MERRFSCNYCKQTVYVAPSAQHIRCFGCYAVLSVSDSNDGVHHSRTSDTNVVRYKGLPPSDQHINCIGWEIDYSYGNTRDNRAGSSMTRLPRAPEKIKWGTEDRGRRKKFPNSNVQQKTVDTIHYKGTTELSLGFSKEKSEAKQICHSLRKRLPFSNDQQAGTTTYPPPISMRDQPPRGRRALLCGVSYKKQKHELKGVAHDVKNINKLLLEHYHFPTQSILILAEEEPYLQPTRANIQEAFQWLVRGIRPGDSLVFYFSGHGKRQRDYIGDEIDGFDETICPVDFEKNGMIGDNDINEAIVRPLTKDVTLHAIIDSCHSWNVLELQCVYNITRGKWEDNSPPSGAYKGTCGGKAICFSACADYQLAEDISAFSEDNKEITGAMTTTFINAVKNSSITYQGIMDSIHNSIKDAGKPGGFFAGIRRIFHRRILQDPQLSSSEEFDTNTEFKL